MGLCRFFADVFVSYVYGLGLYSSLAFFRVCTTALRLGHDVEGAGPGQGRRLFIGTIGVSMACVGAFFMFFLFRVTVRVPVLF